MLKEQKRDFFLRKSDLKDINSSIIWEELGSNPAFIRRVISNIKKHINKKHNKDISCSSIEHTIQQIGFCSCVSSGIEIKIEKSRMRITCV
jgi:hypothetical protein